MCDTSATPRIRTFALPGVAGAPFALGMCNSSWFLLLARRAAGPAAPQSCINYICSPATVLKDSSQGHPRFVLNHGPHILGNQDILQTLLTLRDKGVKPPICLTGAEIEGLPVVEVTVPKEEILHGCAHCGKWEALDGKRFQQCEKCRARHYCSNECEMNDWHPQLHQADCEYIQAGREFEVVLRRQLHRNDWKENLVRRTSTPCTSPVRAPTSLPSEIPAHLYF